MDEKRINHRFVERLRSNPREKRNKPTEHTEHTETKSCRARMFYTAVS